MELTQRFDDALREAFRYHGDQSRKGDAAVPYMGHLLGVTSIVIDAGGTEDQVIAALLHDAPEDQGGEVTLEEIRVKFGDNVAGIVKDLSDTFEDPKPPWKKRKEDYLDHLQTVSDSTLLVSLADKLHNVQSITLDREQVGEKVWDRFTGKREGSLWYYRALGEIYGELMADSPLLQRYLEIVDELATAGPDLRETGFGS